MERSDEARRRDKLHERLGLAERKNQKLEAENEKLKEFAKFQLGMPCKITSQEVVDIAKALSEQQ